MSYHPGITVNGRPLGQSGSGGHLRALAHRILKTGVLTHEWTSPGPVLQAAGMNPDKSKNRKLLKAVLQQRPEVEIRTVPGDHGLTITEYRLKETG